MENIKISSVVADKNQPRKYFSADKMKSLRDSIKRHGIVNPLIVEKTGEKFLLVDGERRFRAASDLGFKEVPCFVIKSKDPISRLIEQFHIQEQHEGWTSAEKAQVLIDLSEQSDMSIDDMCESLGIGKRVAERYLAFGRLTDASRTKMIQNQIPLDHAEKISSLKRAVKKIKENIQEEKFDRNDELRLEKKLIEAIGEGEIKENKDYIRLRDVFTMNPKLVEKFIETKQSVSEMFVKSHAKSAYHMRNMIANANYLGTHAGAYIQNPDVKMTRNQLSVIRRANELTEKVLSLVGDID